MPNHKSAKKRMRQNEKRKLNNRTFVSRMRTIFKKVLSSTEKAQAEPILTDAYSVIDKLAQKGLIHQNNAANKKARLAAFVNKLA